LPEDAGLNSRRAMARVTARRIRLLFCTFAGKMASDQPMRIPMFRGLAFTLALLAAGMAIFLSGGAGVAQEEQGKDLGEVVTDLLRGAGETVADERRVPFGRTEMQLSFAPLV